MSREEHEELEKKKKTDHMKVQMAVEESRKVLVSTDYTPSSYRTNRPQVIKSSLSWCYIKR